MSRRRRFACWVLLISGCLLAAPLRLVEHDAVWVLAGVLQAAGLVWMLCLLATTPEDAIRIDRVSSWTLILSGVWVNLVCATPTPTGSVFVAAGVLAVLVPVLVWSSLSGVGDSPWWVALVAWSPSFPMLVSHRVTGEPGWVMVVSWGVCAAGLVTGVIVMKVGADRIASGEAWDWRPSGMILGITTGLSGLVVVLS